MTRDDSEQPKYKYFQKSGKFLITPPVHYILLVTVLLVC